MTLEGSASASGELRWSPGIAWNAAATATRINPGLIRSELPGHVSFGFTGSGNGFREDADFALQVRNLNGQLRGLAVRGSGARMTVR